MQGGRPQNFGAASELLRVLSAPVRLAIITKLADGPAAVHELTDHLGESQPLISQHLRVLRAARLIRAQVHGRERVYELVDEHVAHIVGDAVRHTTEDDHASATTEEKPAMTSATHTQHDTHDDHTHGDGCGHVAVPHADHVDYVHDGHLHREHDGHVDECEPAGHVEHAGHDHAHGDGCGHDTVTHGDHVDYVHDGHRHAEHDGHVDDH